MINHLGSIFVAGTLLSAAGVLAQLSTEPRTQPPASLQVQPAETLRNMTLEMCPKSDGPAGTEHAYHKEPPTGPLPPTLSPAQFAENKGALVTYSIAGKIRQLLYREPCYCACDKEKGHKSLLDCYTSDHGAHCHTCQRAVIFIYEQSRARKTATEIRGEMDKAAENGEFWKLDIDKYIEAHFAEYKQQAP
jgi:hypothetical protein